VNISVRIPEREATSIQFFRNFFSTCNSKEEPGEIASRTAVPSEKATGQVARKEWGGGTVRGERSPRGIGPSPAGLLPARAFLSRKFVRLQGERVNLGWWYTAV